jgi:hypothetical protein
MFGVASVRGSVSTTTLVDCTDSRTLFVRNPEHLSETTNSRAFMHVNPRENMLEPDNWQDGNVSLPSTQNIALVLVQN